MLLKQSQAVPGIIQLHRMNRKGIPQLVGADVVLLATFYINQPGQTCLFSAVPYYLPCPVTRLMPNRGGFLRPFGCGWFIREFLLGNGPEGSTKLDPSRGSTQADINFEYKEALARATARERAERIISRMVLSGADVTEEQADRIYESELKRVSRKFTHMRYHSFLMYFGVLKRLGWVEVTDQTEPSAIQDNYPPAPERVYYRLTKQGVEAGEALWSNPLFTLYPEIGPSHAKKTD